MHEDSFEITMFQTADPLNYAGMLGLTTRVNALYCQRHGLKYFSYVGIKSGVAAWQATYNRIFLLNELANDGYRGWVIYLDADAFVCDMAFDLRDYLSNHKGFSLIGAPGGEASWNINAGVLFLNMGESSARELVSDWLSRFLENIPADYLADVDAAWDTHPNDQVLLHQCIQANAELNQKTKRDPEKILNGRLDGTALGGFIKQAIRASFYDYHERLSWIKEETEMLLTDTTRSMAYQSLTELANKYGSDKGNLIGNQHAYTDFYQFLFEKFRANTFEFLELGLLRGGPEVGGSPDRTAADVPSVRMWLDYFPNAYCHGFDISDFGQIKLDRFRFHRGDLGNIDDFSTLKAELPSNLLFIIDDASHASFHQQLAFSQLFNHVASGGYYIIEDLDWQPESYELSLPHCTLTRDVVMGFIRSGRLHIECLSVKERATLAEQIACVMVHRRNSDGIVKMMAIQRR